MSSQTAKCQGCVGSEVKCQDCESVIAKSHTFLQMGMNDQQFLFCAATETTESIHLCRDGKTVSLRARGLKTHPKERPRQIKAWAWRARANYHNLCNIHPSVGVLEKG